MRNNERIIRQTKRALSWLNSDLSRSSSSHQPRSTLKRARRSLQQIKDAALREQGARRYAKRCRRSAAWKWLRSCDNSQDPSTDVSVMQDTVGNMDNQAIKCRFEFSPLVPRSCSYCERAINSWQSDATNKKLRAHMRRTGKDITCHMMFIESTHWSTDKMALELPDKRTFDLGRERLRVLRTILMINRYSLDLGRYLVFDYETCLQLTGRGWKVIAAYLASAMVRHEYGHYRSNNCYYLAINPVTAEAILSPFRPDFSDGFWEENYDGSIITYPADALSWPALLGMQHALRSALSAEGWKSIPGIPWLLKSSCKEMYRYAQGTLDPTNHAGQLRQQGCYSEAVAALYATFMWTCPLVLSAGQSAPWLIGVWTPKRLRGIVRLQARVRGWLLRRELYSPHTELGQRRLQHLWASFQNDY